MSEQKPKAGITTGWMVAFAMVAFAAFVGWGAATNLYFKSSDATAQVRIVELETAYGHLVEASGECAGTDMGQQILIQHVTGWTDYSSTEAAFLFADWRGDVNGALVAEHLHEGAAGAPSERVAILVDFSDHVRSQFPDEER